MTTKLHTPKWKWRDLISVQTNENLACPNMDAGRDRDMEGLSKYGRGPCSAHIAADGLHSFRVQLQSLLEHHPGLFGSGGVEIESPKVVKRGGVCFDGERPVEVSYALH